MMLYSIFKFFSPTLANVLLKPAVITPHKKHLVIETHYSTAKIKPDQNEASPVNKTSLEQQAAALAKEKYYQNAIIEKITLNEGTTLIGLTRHLKPLFNGIFVHPASLQNTPEWDDVKKSAQDKNTGIALFETSSTVNCLKISRPGATHCYLIDHQAIVRKQSLVPANNNKAIKDISYATNRKN